MIRFLDIQRQTTWQKKIQLVVLDVGRPQEVDYGFCQCIQAADGMNREEPLNYFYDDEVGRVEATETGNQWYDVRWNHDKEYFQCRPSEAPPKDEFEKNVWEEKDLRISKMNCVTNAIRFLKLIPDILPHERTKENVTVIAEYFRKYIYGEDE